MWTYCEFNAHLSLLLDSAAGQACFGLLDGYVLLCNKHS